jgi:hypothetical protein
MYRGRDPFCDCLISIIELTQNQYKTLLPPNEILSTYIEINLNQHMRAQENLYRGRDPYNECHI